MWKILSTEYLKASITCWRTALLLSLVCNFAKPHILDLLLKTVFKASFGIWWQNHNWQFLLQLLQNAYVRTCLKAALERLCQRLMLDNSSNYCVNIILQNRLRVEFIFIEIILATFILFLHFYCFVVLRNIFFSNNSFKQDKWVWNKNYACNLNTKQM